MSRRRYHDPAGSVSLFPFLAVLISTMGSLILLLVVYMQQARTHETSDSAELPSAPAAGQLADANAPHEPSLTDQFEDLTWQIAALSESRERTLTRLQEAKLKLSMTEDQTRQLQDQLDRLEKEAQQLETVRDRQTDAAAAQTAKLESTRTLIAATRAEVETVREQAARRGPHFTVIPYKGPSGTDRRPIYVECQADRVVIQPEGIELTASDFQESAGPNNPLAMAMRAVREYWLNARLLDSAGHAYPLLIVRPQGAQTYAACRQALRGWDDEFGYELIPDTMELTYPPADPSLARLLQETIRDARTRADLPIPSGGGTGAAQGTGDTFAAMAAENGGGVVDGVPGEGPTTGDSAGGDRDAAGPGGKAPSATDRGAATAGPVGATQGEFGRSDPNSPSNSAGASVQPPGMVMDVTPMSASHGKNWALPNSAGSSIGMSRPVVVFCELNRLVLPPPSGERGAAEEFVFDATVQTAIPPFVDALWRRIDSWGTAGYGAFWKPTLMVVVDPKAEAVYQRFARLMENSGLEIERRVEE